MGNPHRKSMIREALDRLDTKMAVGKDPYRVGVLPATGKQIWVLNANLIYSSEMRSLYQEHVLHFVHWVRETYAIKRLEMLDPRACDLVSVYLKQQIDEGMNQSTLQAARSALRLFFANQSLADDVPLPC